MERVIFKNLHNIYINISCRCSCFSKQLAFPSLLFSILFHLTIIALLIGVFNSKRAKINTDFKISPVLVMSGQEFESLKSHSKKKKSIIKKSSLNSKEQLAQSDQKNKKIGNKNSLSDKGLNLNLPVNLNSKDYNNSYLNIMANQLEKYKTYISMDLAPEDVQDKVIFKVKLNKEGNLTSYKVLKYSDYNFFDKAAKKILELASPFPKPPLELHNSLEFTIPIMFDTV